MQLFTDNDIAIEYIWHDEQRGGSLRASHLPTGILVERTIGFDDQATHRQELRAELARQFESEYPPQDFVIQRMWLGPGKGAALHFQHTPTGLSVRRNIGFEGDAVHLRQLLAELFDKMRAQRRQP